MAIHYRAPLANLQETRITDLLTGAMLFKKLWRSIRVFRAENPRTPLRTKHPIIALCPVPLSGNPYLV